MSRKINVTPISDTAQMPLKKGSIEFMQLSKQIDITQLVIGAIGDSFDGSKMYVLWGCENTGIYPNYNISAGAVWFFGEVFEVNDAIFAVTGSDVAVMSLDVTQYTTDADPVTFTDAVARDVHDIRKITPQAGASGSGYANYSAIVFDAFRYPQATETVKGVAELATQIETDNGLDDLRIVTPAKLEGAYGMVKNAWTLRSNVADVTVTGGSGITVTTSLIKYKTIGKTMHIQGVAVITNTTAPNTFSILVPDSKTCNLGFGGNVAVSIFDNATAKYGYGGIADGSDTIVIALGDGVSLTNTHTITVRYSATFEIA